MNIVEEKLRMTGLLRRMGETPDPEQDDVLRNLLQLDALEPALTETSTVRYISSI